MTDQREVEQRLRDALRARAREFPISPDAWEKTRARRGDSMNRLRSTRGGWLRWTAPLAAAAAVVTIALALLAEHGQPGQAPAGSRTPTASPPLSPVSLPSPSPVPKGLRVPAACGPAPSQPPAYRVTDVSSASMPAPARDWFTQAPPVTGIVRVDVSYRGDRSVTYLWFTHHSGYPEMLEHRTAELLPTIPNLDTVQWHGAGAFETSIPGGQPAQQTNAEGDRLVTYAFGLASGQVASVTVSGGTMVAPIGLDGSTAPVSGLVTSGHDFPYRVWMAAFPATPLYGHLVFRDAAGKTLGQESANPFPLGTMCVPLVGLDYQPPRDGYAYSTGVALPQVASVTAVLPDGTQVPGAFYGPVVQMYYREWEVRFPASDANVTVTLVFRDAAGRVLGHLATVPGKNPFTPVKPVKPVKP
jgi:hypothetical protein